jgi:7-cyano-7-deazaguanine reductase
MSTVKLDNSNISVHLGQTSKYKSSYDESLLVREPRSNNRTHLNIDDDKLPFVGGDIWNAYEVSALTETGVPVTGFAKIYYPCDSKYIVESKSIKLYFNSFNMTKLGRSVEDVMKAVEYMASRDLSKLLETQAKVRVFPADVRHGTRGYFKHYTTLESIIDIPQLTCNVYSEDQSLIEIEQEFNMSPVTQRYHSSLLKSNCRVTSQPDWGDIYVHMKSLNTVAPESLLRYIVSFRDECHFHEEICETVYKRLYDIFSPDELMVTCLYVRRGGIDINPVRANKQSLLDDGDTRSLLNVNHPFIKTSRQ